MEEQVNLEQIPQKKDYDFDTLCCALDGLLLLHNKAIDYGLISEALDIRLEETEELVLVRKRHYEEDCRSGLQIVITEDGVQLATKAKVSEFIQRMDGQKLVSLSLPALETLSVIAFKQPITKAEIDAIRGVNCDGVISTLLEKKLIYVSGERQTLGKPRLYSTTQDFLFYFGMKSLKELPIPSMEIPRELTPEGQNGEMKAEELEVTKEFNESQGFIAADMQRLDNTQGEE